MLKTSLAQLRTRLPGPQTARWPAGERFAEAFAHGSMSVELYVPDGSDPQQAHERDEVYFVVSGSGEFVLDAVDRDVEVLALGCVLVASPACGRRDRCVSVAEALVLVE